MYYVKAVLTRYILEDLQYMCKNLLWKDNNLYEWYEAEY